ncbi:MAG: BamA/TamA family outer membrane protein [Armatimonadota bacterium]|nr:BamA/TamA family outer membrane protein [Armatimonadota bacterium]
MRARCRANRAFLVLSLSISLLVLSASWTTAQQPPPQIRRVAEVVIQGNVLVPTATIRGVISTRVGEAFEEEKVRRDVQNIMDLGLFADVTVRIEEVRDGLRIIFIVLENPVVREVRVSGNTVIPTEEILKALSVPVGEILNTKTLSAGARKVEKLYEDRGYVLARVADVSIDEQGRLSLVISEGRLERVEFKGLVKTKEFVVQRELTIKSGDVFNVEAINKDLRKLLELGYFESVRAQPSPGSTPDSVVLTIELVEQKTGEAKFGLGYSDRTGFVGSIEFGDRNFQGRGQQLSLRLERGVTIGSFTAPTTPKLNYEITFREPWFDAQRTFVELRTGQIFSLEREYGSGGVITGEYELGRTGSSMTIGRPLDPLLTATLTIRSEQVTLDVLSGGVSLFTPGRTVSLALGAIRDARDNRFNPTSGERMALQAEIASSILGSDFSFVKSTAEYSRYVPMGKEATLAARAMVGISSGTLPLQDRFVLGGPLTLRGYPVGRLRATSMGFMNVEYRVDLRSLSERLQDIQGVIYVDAGTAPLTGGPLDLLTNWGLAVSVKTPIGPIRIDYAVGREGSQTWLTIGHPF